MPIPNDVTRVVIGGTSPGGEIFETGFWLNTHAPLSDDAANVMAGALVTSFDTDLLPALKTIITPDTAYATIRVYAYPTGGPHASFVGEADIPSGAGTDTTGSTPLQLAMCATLLTGSVGRRARGRMFFPATGFPYNAHMFASARVDAIATALATFFTNWNSDHGDVMGTAAVVSTAASAARNITNIKIDDKPDTQRRRANRLAATHTAVDVVTV